MRLSDLTRRGHSEDVALAVLPKQASSGPRRGRNVHWLGWEAIRWQAGHPLGPGLVPQGCRPARVTPLKALGAAFRQGPG